MIRELPRPARKCLAQQNRGALGPATWTCGTTSRAVEGRPWLTPRALAGELARRSATGEVAVVFGEERRGLSDAELELCQAVCTIPTSPAYDSMNLAQAVAVIAYEIAAAGTVAPPPEETGAGEPARHATVEALWERARAMAFMRRALERSDRLPLAERLRMQALYDWNRGDYDQAGTAYRALLELNPADGGALNNLGGTYADRGDPIRADSCFRAALRLDPEATAPAYNHTLVLLALRQYDSARAYLGRRSAPLDVAVLYPTTLLKAATEPAESLLAFARRARAGARDAQAAMFAETAEMNALWASGRMREGDVHESALVPRYRSQGLNAAALEMALARASTRVFVQGDVSGAAAAVDSALAEWPLAGLPAVDRPHLPLASSLALAGRPAAARRALEGYRAALRSAEVIPEPAGERLASGLIALAEGRPADAVTDLRQAHDLPMPTGLPARYCRSCATLGLARAYDALGARDSAIAAYERFTDQPEPDRFWILFALAPAHERLSDLYAARGDRNRSALHGAAFLRLWERADPALQPRVVAMRRRLEQLGTDRPLPR